MQALKVIALLLHYPDEVLQRHCGELAEVLGAEHRLAPATRRRLQDFVAELQDADLMDLQAIYVGLFDRSRSLSLHLFEHVHGESRDRGQAMVELQELYHEAGFVIAAKELPDYLPLFLEFCSQLPEEAEARDWLQRSAHLLQELQVRLEQRESRYAVLFEALLELGQVAAADAELRRQIHQEARDDTAEALDRVWEEDQVTFGPTAGCGGAKTHTGQTVPVDASRLYGSEG